MKKVRVIFETSDVARFISHLDLSRLMQFALRRSDLPVWYTEGFNQHLYLTFSNPLSLGFINRHGIMEIKLTDDDFDAAQVAPQLDACLPDSIRAVESYESERKFSEIAFSDYQITLSTEDPEKLEKGLRAKELMAVKRGKAGEREVDLAPYIKGLKIETSGKAMNIRMRLPASAEFNINPGLVLDTANALSGASCSDLRVIRIQLLDGQGKFFR